METTPFTVLDAVLAHASGSAWPASKTAETELIVAKTKDKLVWCAPEVMWHRVQSALYQIDTTVLADGMTEEEVQAFHDRVKPVYDAYIREVDKINSEQCA